MLNPANTDNNSQYNMQAFEVNNMLKNLFENNSNALAQNIGGQDNLYFQQNKLPNQYYINVAQNYPQIQQQYMPMMPLSNGNMIYINQHPQFAAPNDLSQYNNGQILPSQVQPGVMQNSDTSANKPNDQVNVTNSRSRKKTYKTPSKPGTGSHLIDPNEDIPRDTRNRPLSFSCSECSKRFSTQSRLDQHFLCHTNERPYVCSECLFAFTQKSYLMRHAAVHREERSFECELCKKTYKHYGSLANHRKTHKNGMKPSTRPPSVKDHSVTNGKIINIKTEDVVDINTNSSNSYVPVNNTEYLFQNPPEIKPEIEQHQSYNTQYNIDIAAAMFAHSFQNQSASNLTTDAGPSFLDQLNFNNANFYSINANTDASLEANSRDHTTELENHSMISMEYPSQQISLNQSNVQDESIPTYTV